MDEKENIELNNSLKLIAKSSVIVFVGIVLSKIFTYLYRIILAREFGPEVYGIFSLSLMVIGWFVVFSGFGLSSGMMRFFPLYRSQNKEEKSKYIFYKALKILLLTSIISGTILFFLSEMIAINVFNEIRLIIFLKIFSITIPLTILLGVFANLLRSYEYIGWFSFIVNVLQNLLNLIVLFILVGFGLNYLSIPISYVLALILTLIIALIISRKKISQLFFKKITKKYEDSFKDLFNYSWPLMFFGFISSILLWTDSFLVGIFKGVFDVGIYNAAAPIALLILVSKDLFIQLFFPLVTREYGKNNLETVKELTKQVGKWVFVLSLPIFLMIMVFPGVLLNLFFGKEFLAAENALRFLAIGTIFVSLFDISKELLSIKGRSKLILADIIFASLLNLALNLILIPKFGIEGAAFSTMCSLIILNLIFLIQARIELKTTPLRRSMIKIFLLSLIPLAVLIRFSDYLNDSIIKVLFAGLIFILFYFGIILLFCIDKNDRVILSALSRKFNLNFKSKILFN